MTNLDAVLTSTIRAVISDRPGMDDINRCQAAGLDVLTACRNLYGWTDPADNIACGEMNAVQFVQALQLARAQRDRQARQ